MMKTISLSTLITYLKNRKHGICTVEYFSKKKTNDGNIYKLTKTQCQLGADYRNTKGYVPSMNPRKENNVEYIIPNVLKRNTRTENTLFVLVPFSSRVHKVQYFDMEWQPIPKEIAEAKIIESPHGKVAVYTPNAEQIVYIK